MRKWVFLAVLLLLGAGAGGYFSLQDGIGPLPAGIDRTDPLTRTQAETRLAELLQSVKWTRDPVQRRAKVKLGRDADLKNTLPDIAEYPMVVDPPVSRNDLAVEIFVTTIRSGPGTDGLWVERAQAFNAENITLNDGRRIRIRVRKIASGTAYQFIAARKYRPDAFSPVHHLWIRMAEAHGIPMTQIRERTAISVGGVVLKNSLAEKLRSETGGLDIKSLINQVVEGKLAMGYTNPFASSTGLNFLLTVLSTFADGDASGLLSPPVVSAFERFQNGVPFVALTTVHMRESVRNDGSLDAFVMGYQTFINTPELRDDYTFLPFGVVHNQPLHAVGTPRPGVVEALEAFARFLEGPESRDKAKQMGWDTEFATRYAADTPLPSGETLIRMQKLWKEKKDAGRPIAAVFLSDISGSMQGSRIREVKKALTAGGDFISPGNAIGLVLFNDLVRVVLPIDTFGLNQRAAFQAAVEDMDVTGGTHMYDGIAVSLKLLVDHARANPEVKPMLFVLTDGETRGGIAFKAAEPVISGLKIPVYTIGYEANVKELKRLSGLVEAVSLNAAEGNIRYRIGELLNSQM